jgi:3-methyl-2-oxobutanoate hydroxymethyltransferase
MSESRSELRPVRAPDLALRKQRGERLTMIAVYDATMATLFDQSGVDILLVGDSLGMTILGHNTTVTVTLDHILHHTRAVARGAKRALVVADMPFLSHRISDAETIRGAGSLLQQGGAAAVKLEGGHSILGGVSRLVEAGVPVMGHLGLTPQSVHQLGGFRTQAKQADAAKQLLEDALGLERAGAFALVLECIPGELAAEVTAALRIPTIGIGAGPRCDGQVLVSYDMLGLFEDPPPFAKQYAHLRGEISRAASAFVDDVKSGRFPQ